MNDKRTGIGLSKWWMEPDTHPFYSAAKWHDTEYDLMYKGYRDLTLAQVDEQFFLLMKAAAGNSWRLRILAHVFYHIAHIYGLVYWEGKKK